MISFDVTEGTFLSVDVSPDGKTLVFDLLGDIYLLPIEGGQAIPITTGRAWDKAPRYSPDGSFVYFVSDREGFRNIWRLDLAEGSLTAITESTSDILGTPNWAGDRTSLLAGVGDADRMNAEVFLNSVSTGTGAMRPIEPYSTPAFDWENLRVLRPYVRVFSAVQAADGQLYYSKVSFDERLGRRVARIYTMGADSHSSASLTPPSAAYSEYKPQLSRDGRALAYFRQYADRRTEVRLLDRSSGSDVALLELADADDVAYGASQEMLPNYSFTPDGRQIIFCHGGQINRLNIASRSSEIIPFRASVHREVQQRTQPEAQLPEEKNASVIRWPSLSRDGRRMTFAAFGFVWVMDMQDGQIQRLTSSDELEYMPAISRDGQNVAYVSYSRSGGGFGPGRLMIGSVDGGEARELLARSNTSYILPNWSEDGARIAAIQEVTTPDGIDANFGWTGVATGRFHAVSPSPATNDYLSGHIYSRFVGFDSAGQTLLFSFPESRTRTVLASAELDGTSVQVEAIGSSDVGGIVPSPNLRNLALTRRDGGIWLLPYNRTLRSSFVSTSSAAARRISESSGYYLQWIGSSELTYGFGRKVHHYEVSEQQRRSVNVEIRRPDGCAGKPVALIGARLLTMADVSDGPGIIDRGTVVVRGPIISAVGRASEVKIPPNASVVDLSGKTMTPGLIDSHYHRIGGSGGAIGLSALKLPNASFNDKSALGYGITTAWEPGGLWDDGGPATADLQRAERILGPRWLTSAIGAIGSPWEYLGSYEQALAIVDKHKALGVLVLKEYNTPTRSQQQWLSAAAQAHGLGIISHLESLDGMMTRVVDGYTGGEHSSVPIPFYDDVRQLLRRTGYVWTPNISITSGSIGETGDAHAFYWQEVQAERPEQLDKLRSMTSPDRIAETDFREPSVPYNVHRVSRVAEQAAVAALDGVHIGVSGHNMPGANLHKEMWYLWRGGLSAHDVLRAATIGNAEKLGISEDVGTLEAGKTANILVFDENPLGNLLNTTSIKYTIQEGAIYDSDTSEKLRPEDMEGFAPAVGDDRDILTDLPPQGCIKETDISAPT
jgi:Tol biopolymer transport system component